MNGKKGLRRDRHRRVAFTVFFCVKDGIEKFNAYNDWSRWAVFVPVAGVAVIAGGGWLWWVYFARHHAMIIWPVIVAAIVAALVTYRQKAEALILLGAAHFSFLSDFETWGNRFHAFENPLAIWLPVRERRNGPTQTGPYREACRIEAPLS